MRAKYNRYISALRLDRWPRSLAIIPGFIAALVLYPPESPASAFQLIFRLLVAFLLTWAVSTANYIVNEIADAPYDAHHPSKKNRPLVRKEISRGVLLAAYGVMSVLALAAGAWIFNTRFVLSLGALLAAGIIYNVPPVRFKDVPILDSTVESANNPIRFLIGWYIFIVPFPPACLLISWWAFGNFLMVGKRVAEKKFLTAAESAAYRLSLKRYSMGMLVAFMVFNAIAFLTTFAWFVWQQGWKPFLFILPLILVYLIMFMFKSLQDREGAEEPERLLKNPYFAIYTLFLVLVFLAAYWMR
ncbi:MAG: UbiA family prenyltransferase [Acidobacteriota bacterium]|jgi:4-hydroxybenzoate polyprenyltransferase|nr:UbiA family prenyltransferase [Acidobacteriota bacterium]